MLLKRLCLIDYLRDRCQIGVIPGKFDKLK